MFELEIRGGWVLDGTGAPAYRADVGLAGGRIAAVGRLGSTDLPAGRVIDATDRYLVPGFVDAHVHGDAKVFDPLVQLAALRQGVTTFVLGQDGLSFAPASPAALAYVTRYFAAVNGAHPALNRRDSGTADQEGEGSGQESGASGQEGEASGEAGARDSGPSRRSSEARGQADRTGRQDKEARGQASGTGRRSSEARGRNSGTGGWNSEAGGRLNAGPVSVAELLDTYRGTTALNTAYLVPHGTVRFSVLGSAHRAPDGDELARMVALVEGGLADGAVGLSTGLEYLPGRYAEVAELQALCAPVAAGGLPYVTHMRGYETAAAMGMAEVRAIAVGTGVAAHVSHYHGPAGELTGLVDAARDSGLDITFDSYPYLRGCSILAMVALPAWLDDADLDRTVAALADPAVRGRVAAQVDPGLWPRIALAHLPDPQWSWAEGLRLTEAAARAGTSPAELCLDLLVATDLVASTVFDHPPTNSDESVRALLRHPAQMGGSDGIYIGNHPHPRGWGAFARLLGRHVRELGDWSWPEAVVHLAAHPARRFGLVDRGLIRPGLAADLVVLDPRRVGDQASYDRPRELAVGIDDVVVNGVVVLRGGQLTGARPGQPLTSR